MNLLSKLFHFVLLTVKKHNIDESHGLKHSMDILTTANNIYEQEVVKYPFLKEQEKIIYVSSVVHDMCDKKYMDQNKGIENINNYITSLKDSNKNHYINKSESEIVKKIISTMSYSYVKKNGFPDMGKYQTAYNIVREADLLSAYDFDRCIIYQMNQSNSTFEESFDDAVSLFEKRMFKHNEDGLFFTDYAKQNYQPLENHAKIQINQWKRLIRKNI